MKNTLKVATMFQSKLLLTTMALATMIVACRPDRESSLDDAAVDYKGQIRVSLRHPTSVNPNLFYLVVSVPQEYQNVSMCAGIDAEGCNANARTYSAGRKLNVTKPRSFFLINGVAELSEAGRLVFVVRDAGGKIVDSRALQFTKGDIPAVGALPSAAPSAGPSVAPSGVANPTASTPILSNGTGGVTGSIQTLNFRDSTGTASSYKVNAPADANTKPYGLHIHLHGDGGTGFEEFHNKDIQRDLISVAVLSPDNRRWGRAGNGLGRKHSIYVDELIEKELTAKYNIDRNRIYFSGVSGGAYFLSSHFIPLYGAKYRSGAMLLCGGERPGVTFSQVDMLKSFRIHWEITRNDDISLGSTQSAIAAYKAELDRLGVAPETIMTTSIDGNGGHCEFGQNNDYSRGIVYMLNAKFATIVK